MDREYTPGPRRSSTEGRRASSTGRSNSSGSPQNAHPASSRQYSGGSSRHPAPRGSGNRRKKKKTPPIVPLLAVLLVVVLIIILCVNLFGGKGQENPPEGASSGITASASPDAGSDAGSSEDDASSIETPQPDATPTPTPTPVEVKAPAGDSEALDTLYRIGGVGYEYYSFIKSTAEDYITVISNGGKKMVENGANVYNMIIPTSMDVMLPDDVRGNINTTSQKDAIDYIYKSINTISPQIKTIPILDVLKQHANEYIYFRTDHHWTQLGAYYAYREFCNTKGITPLELTDYDKKEYPGYLGSFYTSSKSADMSNAPDTVEAYIPKNDNTTMMMTESDGTTLEWPVVANGEDYPTSEKYIIFVGGDQPYEEITNNNLTDGSSCLVVKESFGNAFAPLLTPHYQTIYVVDYRKYDGNIADLAKEKGVQDVVMVNNVSMTRNEYLVNTISNRF